MAFILRQINSMEASYIRANRCWRSNNLKLCLLICDRLTRQVAQLQPHLQSSAATSDLTSELERLKNLVWYLKIRCLADDYYLNEPLLLNDEDLGDDEDTQVRLIDQARGTANQTTSSAAGSSARPLTSSRSVTAARRQLATTTTGSRRQAETTLITSRHHHTRTAAILTGKRSSLGSRQSSQGTVSSYRPLTTSLTATQTAFSRSTRPLLKYVACSLLAMDLFEYLYNVQTITNKCPDYRQCLEYLNLVRKSIRKTQSQSLGESAGARSASATSAASRNAASILLDISSSDSSSDEKCSLGSFWLNSFGICYFNLRMNNEAQEYFNLSRELNPKSLDAYTWLVKVYLRTNQPNQVLRTCRLGLQHCRSSILYNWMARVQSLVNDLYKANLSLRESLQFHPTNIEALANVGHFAFYADKPELSLKCFERIQQLSINQSVSLDSDYQALASFSQLLNNLALSYFRCGHYYKVVPLFFRALLNSPNKEITSDIWYNISFVPLACGFIELTIACLKMALTNDSQNVEALNNLGVLKCRCLVNDNLHFANKQELWGLIGHKPSSKTTLDSVHLDGDSAQNQELTISMDEIQTFFRQPSTANQTSTLQQVDSQPEMLYNMAVIEKRRGKLLSAMQYCQLYSQHDQNNYHIQNMMREIRQLVSHTG